MTSARPQVRGIRLGSIKGAQIVVQPSTLLMLVILAFIYSSSADGQITPHAFSLGMLLAVLLFVSVFIHELAHAIAAWSFGRKVETIMLTLWGGVTSFDARAITPKVVGVTALAGPLANSGIALASWGVLQTGVTSGLVEAVIRWLAFANVLLAVFNVLPGIPMDGGKVLQAAVWAGTGDRLKATRVAGWFGRAIAIVVVVAMIGYPLTQGERISLINVAFAFLIFTVIWPSASAAIRAVGTVERRQTASIGALMRRSVGVSYTVSVAEALDSARHAGALDAVVLSADGQPAALASVRTMNRVPEEQRPHEGLISVSVPILRGAVVAPTLEGDELIASLREWYGKTESWVVADEGTVVGVVELQDVVDALQ
ncbi:site-2 protease family protein [Demequina sp.]|uniref:site-2 protease family protein n=1 Tax=Demequina sp. TaxID=2050685 RepID=UPI003D0BE1EC